MGSRDLKLKRVSGNLRTKQKRTGDHHLHVLRRPHPVHTPRCAAAVAHARLQPSLAGRGRRRPPQARRRKGDDRSRQRVLAVGLQRCRQRRHLVDANLRDKEHAGGSAHGVQDFLGGQGTQVQGWF